MQYGPSAHNLLFFMSPVQLLVFALVVTIYFPCIATMGVLGKEIGWRNALGVVGATSSLAVLVGAVAFRVAAVLL
jgi:ferrous iron transport protein B